MTEPARTGEDCDISPGAVVGHDAESYDEPTVLGDEATVRSGSVIYASVTAGDRLNTGHNALVREHTSLGDDVLVGTNAVIDGYSELGSRVRLQTAAYVPSYTTIGDRVFLGPRATLTNDPYPLRQDVDLAGPILEDDVTVGANATVLPGVAVGERSFVAAGAVVTDDVPPDTLVVGAPGTHRQLPEHLQGGNVHA